MLVVFVDKQSDYFTQCFGVESYGEIPLFHKNLYGFIKSNLFSILNDDYVVFSKNHSKAFGDDIVISSTYELIDLIGRRGYERVVFFFLNTFFTLDFDAFLVSSEYNKNFLLCDKNNVIFGAVLDKIVSENLLKSSKNFGLFSLNNFQNLPKINCIENGRIISNIKDYKALNTFIFSSDSCSALPENAQGIYSSGNIPKGDFTIIPPVYFGNDIQIEKGAVIGPFSTIYDSSLVAKNSVINNSVLLNNCYISKDCFLEDCICCSNVSVRRASSIYSGSVIGSNYMLSEESRIENDVYIAEVMLNNIFDLSRLLSDGTNINRVESDEGFVELINDNFNIKYQKRFDKNPKIYLKAASFEIAEEILSDLNLI